MVSDHHPGGKGGNHHQKSHGSQGDKGSDRQGSPKIDLFRRAGQMAEIPGGRQRQRRADDLRLGLKGVDQQEGQGRKGIKSYDGQYNV